MGSFAKSGTTQPQVEEFEYVRVLFTSERKVEHKINWWIGAPSAVIQ